MHNYSHYTKLVIHFTWNYMFKYYAGIPLEARNLRSIEFLLRRCINYPLKNFRALNRKIQGHLLCSYTFYSPEVIF